MSKPEQLPAAPKLAVAERTPPKFALQRKCACGGSGAGALTGACDDCEKNRLQRRAAGSAPQLVPESVGEVLATAGTPLDPSARRDMESRFGHDFGGVRIHTDARAAESARSVNALAYTVGSHVVFAGGQYAPSTHAGRHLLAHELTHTIQQRSGFALQRQEAAVSAPTDAAEVEADRTADAVAGGQPGGLLVEDDAQPASGQMRRTEFLDELQRSSCAAADAELVRVGRSTEGCPFVERAFARYRTMTAARVEQAMRRYIDPAGVTGARDYIPLVTRRVAEGVARWAETGDMSGVPSELADAAGGGGGVLGMLGGGLAGLVGGLVGGISRMLFKRANSADATDEDLLHAQAHLGEGIPLDSTVRNRMEGAFGADFANVRIHADSRAGSASTQLSARAFTIGSDVAFAAGEYRPNTLMGDALIAHELAHVVQQSDGVRTKGGSGSGGPLEEDADRSAVGAIVGIVNGMSGGLARISERAMPRLRSGLRLQSCGPTIQHTGAVTGGTVEARTGRMELFGPEWVTLEYRGANAARRRWLQFVWSETLAEMPDGSRRRVHLFFLSTSAWSRNESTGPGQAPRRHIDSSAASEPFYPTATNATTTSTPMNDRPRGGSSLGQEIVAAEPTATGGTLIQHFDTFLMDNASIRAQRGPNGQPWGIGTAIYHVAWDATTPYTNNGTSQGDTVYRVTGGEAVNGLPPDFAAVVDLMYGQDHGLH
jgi:hypothetical protein